MVQKSPTVQFVVGCLPTRGTTAQTSYQFLQSVRAARRYAGALLAALRWSFRLLYVVGRAVGSVLLSVVLSQTFHLGGLTILPLWAVRS